MKKDVTITCDDSPGRPTTLLLDGEDVSSSVTGLNLAVDPGTHRTELQLYVAPGVLDVRLHGVDVLVDADTHDLLVRLGWVPPVVD